MAVVCFECGTSKKAEVEICDTEFCKMENGMIAAAKAWNTRATLLTPTQLALLEPPKED